MVIFTLVALVACSDQNAERQALQELKNLRKEIDDLESSMKELKSESSGSDKKPATNESTLSDGSRTIEELGEHIIESFGHIDKFNVLLPSKVQLNSILKCEGESSLVKQVADLIERTTTEFAEMDDSTMKVEHVKSEIDEAFTFKKGQELDGCRWTKDIEGASIKITANMETDGEVSDTNLYVGGIKIDRKWYLVDL